MQIEPSSWGTSAYLCHTLYVSDHRQPLAPACNHCIQLCCYIIVNMVYNNTACWFHWTATNCWAIGCFATCYSLVPCHVLVYYCVRNLPVHAWCTAVRHATFCWIWMVEHLAVWHLYPAALFCQSVQQQHQSILLARNQSIITALHKVSRHCNISLWMDGLLANSHQSPAHKHIVSNTM